VNRRLKLAEAVRDAKAYYCVHGRTEEKWRAVVDRVKANDSALFIALKPNSPGSTSWETVRKEWTKIFKEWKIRNDAGASTSGAAETYTELDQICQQIESLRADAEQLAKAGVRRSSFQAPRQEEINDMINGDLRGRARLVARNLGEQLQEARDSGELGDDGGETFTPAPRADNPPSSSARNGRGGSARDAARELEMAILGQARALAEAEARKEEARAEAEARREERSAAQMRAFLEYMENARREDRDRQALREEEERKERARKEEEDRKERAAERAEQAHLIREILGALQHRR
jgi:hypothetical protein